MAHVLTDAYERLFGGEPNLSMTERGISIALGLGLAAAAAKPRPNMLLNVLALAGGSMLALRGATGHCPVKAAIMGSDQPGRQAIESGQDSPDGYPAMAGRNSARDHAGAYHG